MRNTRFSEGKKKVVQKRERGASNHEGITILKEDHWTKDGRPSKYKKMIPRVPNRTFVKISVKLQ